jgi:hypothetical protein
LRCTEGASRRVLWGLSALLVLAGCATRPINPRIDRIDSASGYRYTLRAQFKESDSDS